MRWIALITVLLVSTNGETAGLQGVVKNCAYIVISLVPNADPKTLKGSPQEYKSNMPILRVPPPCEPASRRRFTH